MRTILLRLVSVLYALILGGFATALEIENSLPVVHDSKLQLSLFAADPDIVTPVGIAVDEKGRIFVLESHTHSRPTGYPGPKDDRVKMFVDADGDGRPETASVFADGLQNALNLAISPDGQLYVIQQYDVVTLHDRDGDGRCESRTSVLRLDTADTNPHGVLLGIAFSWDNWLYVTRGNIAGRPYTYTGSDGAQLKGYGDGGDIVRCRPDGTGLEPIATGFWNPFGIDFDTAGRLLCVDNDPDGRGPNRLLHIVDGGDYGHRTRFGKSGLHPYCAWNGELSGTLPMIAGVGEAPAGLLDCNKTSLPVDYANNILVSVWGTNTVARCQPQSHGVSLRGNIQPLIEGDLRFRPVAFAAALDGTVYFTDWVERDYPVHGRGRIWRLAARNGVVTLKPRRPYVLPEHNDGVAKLSRLLNAGSIDQYPELIAAFQSDDPFEFSAATKALGRSVFRRRIIDDLDHADPRVRLGSLLALKRAAVDDPEPIIRKMLIDPDESARKMALVWSGDAMRLALAKQIDRAISVSPTSADLFRTYLATAALLTEKESERFAKQQPLNVFNVKVDQRIIDAVLEDSTKPPEIHAVALRFVEHPDRDSTLKLLRRFVGRDELPLRMQAVRTLGRATRAEAVVMLREIALDRIEQIQLRCDAIDGLSRHGIDEAGRLVPLLNDLSVDVALVTARSLRTHATVPSIREALLAKYEFLGNQREMTKLREQLEFILRSTEQPNSDEIAPLAGRPESDDQWFAALAEPGDAAAGRRVFFHPAINCSQCHMVHGEGGMVGPDLSNVARSADRQRLVRSISHPSDNLSPDYQGYQVVLDSGQVLTGTQFHFRGTKAISLVLLDGREVYFPLDQVEEHKPLFTSLMPEGLVHQMSIGEFRDLLAFLLTLN